VNRPSLPLGVAGLVASCLLGASGCSGPPVPSPIQGEPVCADFEVGAAHTRMRGGLLYPVMLSVKQGKTVVGKAMLHGLRSDKDKPAHVSLPDGNEDYVVEWAQCENEQAPRPVDGEHAKKGAPDRGEAAHYECGHPNVYKTDRLVTRKGDLSSHALTLPPPPKGGCWTSEAPSATAAPSAPPPPAAPASAVAPPASASAAPAK
jgi:hypothetical protein